MARPARPAVVIEQPAMNTEQIRADLASADQVSAFSTQRQRELAQVDRVLLAQGAAYSYEATVAALHICIQRSADELLRVGQALLLIREHSPGQFGEALAQIGMAPRTAQRIMSATLKFWGPKTRPLLELGRSKIYELLAEDDQALAGLADGGTIAGVSLDEIERMSASELRDKLRSAKSEREDALSAKDKLIDAKNQRIDKLQAELDDWSGATEAQKSAACEKKLRHASEAAVAALLPLRAAIATTHETIDRPGDGLHAAMAGALGRIVAEVRDIASAWGIDADVSLGGDWRDDKAAA